jgi:hypothetical protein
MLAMVGIPVYLNQGFQFHSLVRRFTAPGFRDSIVDQVLGCRVLQRALSCMSYKWVSFCLGSSLPLFINTSKHLTIYQRASSRGYLPRIIGQRSCPISLFLPLLGPPVADYHMPQTMTNLRV